MYKLGIQIAGFFRRFWKMSSHKPANADQPRTSDAQAASAIPSVSSPEARIASLRQAILESKGIKIADEVTPTSSIAKGKRSISRDTDARRKADLEPPVEPTRQVVVIPRDFMSMSDDERFEFAIRSHSHLPIEKTFFCKVAGTTFANEDGSSRRSAISGCE